MFGIFKSKEKRQEDKQISLEKELQEFKDKYEEYFICYAYTGKEFVIYKEPEIMNGKIVMNYITVETPDDYVSQFPVRGFHLNYGKDFLKQHKHNFIKLKAQMKKLGLALTKIENIK